MEKQQMQTTGDNMKQNNLCSHFTNRVAEESAFWFSITHYCVPAAMEQAILQNNLIVLS